MSIKKLIAAVLAGIFIISGTAVSSYGQKYRGEVVVNTNAAFSLVGSILRISFKSLDYGIEGLDTKVSPALSGTADVGITDRISIGFGYFHQDARAEWTRFTDPVTDSLYIGSFSMKASRTNYGLRAFLHFGNNDDIDPYFGFRVGYVQWKISTSVNDFELFDAKKFSGGVTFQALFGFRYYFLPFLGVNGELAFGFPYFLSAGISWKFGGMKYID